MSKMELPYRPNNMDRHVLPTHHRKPPLLLVPGMLCDAALWSHQVDLLDRHCEISIADQHQRHDTIDAIVDAIVDEAPGEFLLAGLSMGGYIALEIVRRYPQRVSGLALLDTSARADTAEQTRGRLSQMAQVRAGQFDSVVESLLPRFLHPSRLADPLLVDAIRAMAQRIGPEGYLRQQRAIIGRRDQRDLLASIECPTLVLCGEDDNTTPMTLAEEICRGIPKATLVGLARCGHMSPLERPLACADALRAWILKDFESLPMAMTTAAT